MLNSRRAGPEGVPAMDGLGIVLPGAPLRARGGGREAPRALPGWTMVDVAQLVEPRIVIPAVVGSSPIVHPKPCREFRCVGC